MQTTQPESLPVSRPAPPPSSFVALESLLRGKGSAFVVFATTDGSSVDADLETATSFVRYHVTPEHSVFVDLVGRGGATPWTYTKGPREFRALPPCDLVVMVAPRNKGPTLRVPALALAERTPVAEVLAAIRAVAG